MRRRRCRPRTRSGCSASAGSPTPSSAKRPIAQLAKRRDSYQPGDTDLSWTRITRWRGLLASTLDQPPHDKVISATVAGATDSPSADLLAAWLAVALRCPVKRVKSPAQVRARPAFGRPEPAGRRHQPGPAADHHRRTEGGQPAGAARRPPPPRAAGLPVRGTAPIGRRRRLRRGVDQGHGAGGQARRGDGQAASCHKPAAATGGVGDRPAGRPAGAPRSPPRPHRWTTHRPAPTTHRRPAFPRSTVDPAPAERVDRSRPGRSGRRGPTRPDRPPRAAGRRNRRSPS